MQHPGAPPLSVSERNRSARQLLEGRFGEVWVEGELSGVSRPSSGHVYFTLKDEQAQLRAALFRNRARFVGAPMRDGDRVKVRGRLSIFEPRGDYQLIAEAIQAAGVGELLAAFEALKARLRPLAARYLAEEKNARGLPLNPVARFHLGNGAELHRINWLGDVSTKGLEQGAGLMVN